MLPLEVVFNRFPRMIRDLSVELKKEINFVIEGAETELDRTVIDEIGEPLIHILRNAADHGLESKEERIAAVLEHRYENGDVWHMEGGWTQVLEEELVQSRPAHDDIKDALASAVSIANAPQRSMANKMKDFITGPTTASSRFGGFR